jgi:hypothetical protein
MSMTAFTDEGPTFHFMPWFQTVTAVVKATFYTVGSSMVKLFSWRPTAWTGVHSYVARNKRIHCVRSIS